VPYYFFIWNDEIIGHIAEHGLTQDEYEEIVCNPNDVDISQSSGRFVAFGETSSGKYLACIYEFLGDDTVLPITAYEIGD
jgi:hypothetical protein